MKAGRHAAAPGGRGEGGSWGREPPPLTDTRTSCGATSLCVWPAGGGGGPQPGGRAGGNAAT